MKIFIKRNQNADFCSIIYELEKPMEAVKNNYHMPLVLINLLLEIQNILNNEKAFYILLLFTM